MKKLRLQKLQSKLRDHADQIADEMVGTVEKVLIEGASKKRNNEISGRTENNRIVNLPGTIAQIGKIIKVKITEKRQNSLRGRMVSTA